MDRRKVDFPHPDGPMIAVTALRSRAKVRFRRICRLPYQNPKSRTSTAGPPRSGLCAWGGRGARVARGTLVMGRGRTLALIRISR